MDVEYVLNRMRRRPNPWLVMSVLGAVSGFCSFISIFFGAFGMNVGPGLLFGLSLTLPFARYLQRPGPKCLWMILASSLGWFTAFFIAAVALSLPDSKDGDIVLDMGLAGFVGSTIIAVNASALFCRESPLQTGIEMIAAGSAGGVLFGVFFGVFDASVDSWQTVCGFILWQSLTAVPLGRALRSERERFGQRGRTLYRRRSRTV